MSSHIIIQCSPRALGLYRPYRSKPIDVGNLPIHDEQRICRTNRRSTRTREERRRALNHHFTKDVDCISATSALQNETYSINRYICRIWYAPLSMDLYGALHNFHYLYKYPYMYNDFYLQVCNRVSRIVHCRNFKRSLINYMYMRDHYFCWGNCLDDYNVTWYRLWHPEASWA